MQGRVSREVHFEVEDCARRFLHNASHLLPEWVPLNGISSAGVNGPCRDTIYTYLKGSRFNTSMDRATNITTSETARLDLALLLLRCASAPPFLYHGSAILFGWFGGPGPAKFAASHHWPVFLAYLVGTAQVGGGLAMVSGMFFRSGCA